LKAITVDDGSEDAVARKGARQRKPQPIVDGPIAPGPAVVGERAQTFAPRAGSKLAQVIDLLQRSKGATIQNLIEATGWLPHTTRAALTGLRKRGYTVVRERTGGGDPNYRVPGPATAGADRFLVQTEAVESHDREAKPKANRAA
jgi:hypothetical protein